MNIIEYITEQGLILIPVIYYIGKILKEIKALPDKYIPLVLMAFGIGFTIALMGVSTQSVIQGILITGVTVYGDQTIKQLKKD